MNYSFFFLLSSLKLYPGSNFFSPKFIELLLEKKRVLQMYVNNRNVLSSNPWVRRVQITEDRSFLRDSGLKLLQCKSTAICTPVRETYA